MVIAKYVSGSTKSSIVVLKVVGVTIPIIWYCSWYAKL